MFWTELLIFKVVHKWQFWLNPHFFWKMQWKRTYFNMDENTVGWDLWFTILRQFSSRNQRGGEANCPPGGVLCFFNSEFIFNYKKKLKVEMKEFRRGIEPGSSGWKSREDTIRPLWIDERGRSKLLIYSSAMMYVLCMSIIRGRGWEKGREAATT